ncbi:Transposase, Mutator family [compost metagenome]
MNAVWEEWIPSDALPARNTVEANLAAIAWRRAWDRVIPFFVFPHAIRKVIYTTNAIESINGQLRKIIKTRGHFSTDDAATKVIWLAL